MKNFYRDAAKINEEGLQQIWDALAKHHKLGGAHFDRRAVKAWAAEAEDRWFNTGRVTIVIDADNSLSGLVVVVPINRAGWFMDNALNFFEKRTQ